MKTNKDKFLELSFISKEQTNTLEKNRERIKNRARLQESQQIALKVLNKLDELGWSQRKFAGEMGVTPQQITKIISGKGNLTLETQVKLQQILDIPILATYYEDKAEGIMDEIVALFKGVEYIDNIDYTVPKTAISASDNSSAATPKVKLEYNAAFEYYTYYLTA